VANERLSARYARVAGTLQQDGGRPETGERAPAPVEQQQGGEEDDELGLVEEAAQHHTGDAVAAAPEERIHSGEDEKRQQAVLPVADGRPDGHEGQHPWRGLESTDQPERPHQQRDADHAPERECREVGQGRERHEGQREEGRGDEAVEAGPLLGRRDLVLDSRLDVEVVEMVRVMRGDDSPGGVELDEIGALDVAG